MATSNPTVGKTPSKLIDANVDFFLSLPWYSSENILWATTAVPGVVPSAEIWHILKGSDNEKLNRNIIETSLEIWAYCPNGSVEVVLE